MPYSLRIGTRPSALALAQGALIERALTALIPGLSVEVVPIKTTGDKLTTASLAQIGGKGLFIRELEEALSARWIDLAVHSMKDLPAVLTAPYRIAAVPKRENARDVLITRGTGGWDLLPEGARLGTSSVRRRFEALRRRPDLEVDALRGNVDTRLKRLGDGDFDAIILAIAGLKRLDRLDGLELAELDERDFVPAAGQGALAIEVLADAEPNGSKELGNAIVRLDDSASNAEVTAERAFLATIGASCSSPVGVKGTIDAANLALRALLFSLDGTRSIIDEVCGELTITPAKLGGELGNRMLARGAADLIRDGNG